MKAKIQLIVAILGLSATECERMNAQSINSLYAAASAIEADCADFNDTRIAL